MPIFYTQTKSCVALSSYWDCLLKLPTDDNTRCFAHHRLDWDIVAEYILLGSTLGGKDGTRTLISNLKNTSPGTCVSIFLKHLTSSDGNNKDRDDEDVSVSENSIMVQILPYTNCYGACDRVLQEMIEAQKSLAVEEEFQHAEIFRHVNPPRQVVRRHPPSSWSQIFSLHNRNIIANKNRKDIIVAANVQIEQMKKQQDRLSQLKVRHEIETEERNGGNNEEESDNTIHQLAYYYFHSSIQQAFQYCHILRAALTGGGDTRLALSCLSSNQLNHLIFQTHGKQSTDLKIARWLALRLKLQHRRLYPTKGKEHILMLHEKTPIRKKQRSARKRFKENIPTVTMHGRFGTEFLGFLCFDKTCIPFRSLQDVEDNASTLESLFSCVFDIGREQFKAAQNEASNPVPTKGTCVVGPVSNPTEALRATFNRLVQDQKKLDGSFSSKNNSSSSPSRFNDNHGPLSIKLDVAYAFQLQLFTRSFLCDIYGGLQKGSWFAMPYSFFTRNSFSPFVDAKLLRWIMCSVSAQGMNCPYEWYGKLYKNYMPDFLLQVPSNNKLLCMHAGIPRALKTPEQLHKKALLYPGSIISPKQHCRSIYSCSSSLYCCEGKGAVDYSKYVSQHIEKYFSPLFWDGAIAFLKLCSQDSSSHPRDILLKCTHKKQGYPEICDLVELIGLDQGLLLSHRLANFLLWYESRILPASSELQCACCEK